MPETLPFVSVVVICYNGEATLRDALSSLISQTYPKNRYEIIVVDDGSTDNSPAVAAEFPSVKYMRLEKNMGISSARNAGLKVARGKFYVAFDCDCKADPELLTKLVHGFADRNTIGVGATIVEPEPIKRLATRYISMCDSLFAPVSDKVAHGRKLPHQRLISYIKLRITPSAKSDKPREMTELYGAGGAFYREILLAVGGWDVTLNGIEDRDLSQRLHAAYPEKKFYLLPDAKMVHERGETLWQYLMRPVKRGAVNFEFHRRNKITPPIFPFPILYVAACLGGLFVSPYISLLLIICLPPLLYFWWPYKSLQRRQGILFIFSYIQLVEEIMVLVGLAEGYMKSLQRRRRNA